MGIRASVYLNKGRFKHMHKCFALNHGLNIDAGHYPNPVENTHKQQLTPMLKSVEISVRIHSDVSFCVFYHLKLLSTTGVSLPTAD